MTTLPSRWRSAGLALLLPVLWLAGCSSSGKTNVEVTLTGVSVSPRPTSVAVGATRQLTATATYSDGSTANVTADAACAWVSSITSVATVTSPGGLVTGVAAGTTRVTATFGGKSGFSDVTVTAVAPTLQSIAITPDPATVTSGATLQLTVTGTYSDTSTANVTADATFVSSVTAVATVTSPGGLVTGHSVGAATITATVGAQTARREVTVTALQPPALAQIVFWDGYGDGVNFIPFGGSHNPNVSVDSVELFQGRKTIQFVVTQSGAYSGGSWVTTTPRDLSAYDALTFWAKASEAKTINVTGFGDQAGSGLGAAIKTERPNVPVTTAWQKFTIPIPDPARLTNLGGLFHLAEGAENYTIWLADVLFEHLGGAARGTPAASINLASASLSVAEGGRTTLSAGQNQVVHTNVTGDPALPITLNPVANQFFTFTSSDTNVATVDADGVVTGVAPGSASITATLAGAAATGSYGVTVTSALPVLSVPPPVPPEPVTSVISFYSSVTGGYDGTAADFGSHIDTWRTCWSPPGATGGDPIPTPVSSGPISASPRQYVLGTAGDSYVGIELLGKTGATQPGSCNGTVTGANELDARAMDHLHIDVWTPDVDLTSNFQIKLVDAGADLQVGTGDDSWAIYQINGTSMTRGTWLSLDFALSSPVAGVLTNRAHIGQIVLQSPGGGTFYIDNFYLYSAGTAPLAVPATLPPVPAQPASDVYSLWSSVDPGGLNSTSSDHSGTVSTWLAPWSGGTGGDPFLISSSAGTASPRKWVFGLDAANFVGIEFTGAPIDATALGLNTLHLDLWTPDDASVFNVKVADFGADGQYGGGDDVEGITTISPASSPALATGTWLSYDLPLSSFSGLTTAGHLAQLVLIAPNGGTVYLDNVYFWAATAPPTAPATAPAAPTAPAASVLSLLSATYSGTAGDYSSHVDSYHASCFGPPGASVSDYAIPSAHTVKKYSIGANGFGIIELIGATGGTATPPDSSLCGGGGSQTGLSEIDVSGTTTLHFDVWSPGGSANFQVHLVVADSTGFIAGPGAPVGSTGGSNYGSPANTVAAGSWVSFDIPYSQFGPPTSPSALNRIALVKLFTTTAGEFYVDNLYFYTP